MATPSPLTDAQRKPSAKVAEAAARGLRLREKFGRGGTEVGVRRAHQLKDREAVSDADIKSIYSYFARHTVDKQGEGWADRRDPSAGYIAWLLWGGDPAEAWIGRLHAKLDKTGEPG
jgi:hypothetical protein